jgi:hypothetical protein
VSETVDEHLGRAFASLADVSLRELEATAELLGRRRGVMYGFASVFRGVAYARKDGSDPFLADFHLHQAVEHGGDELAEQIAGAEAPFWGHVRDAVALVSGDD